MRYETDKRYKVLESEDGIGLAALVEAALREGAELQGGVCAATPYPHRVRLYQAVLYPPQQQEADGPPR